MLINDDAAREIKEILKRNNCIVCVCLCIVCVFVCVYLCVCLCIVCLCVCIVFVLVCVSILGVWVYYILLSSTFAQHPQIY